jgi:hypothetical protein
MFVGQEVSSALLRYRMTKDGRNNFRSMPLLGLRLGIVLWSRFLTEGDFYYPFKILEF